MDGDCISLCFSGSVLCHRCLFTVLSVFLCAPPQMPPTREMAGSRTPWAPAARPGRGAGGPRRPSRPTSRPSGPPEPSAASPSATPSAWPPWPSSNGNILGAACVHLGVVYVGNLLIHTYVVIFVEILLTSQYQAMNQML